MSRNQLHQQGLRALLAAAVLTAVFGLGSATAGFLLNRDSLAGHEEGPHDHDEETHDHEEEAADHEHEEHDHDEHEHEDDHVALTKQAFANLQLRMGSISEGDYWKTLLVPGRVVEIPGRSNLSIPASVTGIVEQVNVLPGQTLESKMPLFTIRTTDKLLIDAQARLLEILTRKEVVGQEIARLAPLISSGVVSGTKTRELNYEVKQLEAQESAVRQELETRGMKDSAIDQLVAERRLETLNKIFPPDFSQANGMAKPAASGGVYGYSVEDLVVHPGLAVERGDPLCTVAYHPRLYLEGTAFQDDLPILQRIMDLGWRVTVDTHEHGYSHSHSHGEGSEIDLELLRVDNHVDESSQTVKFYLELPNEVVHTRDYAGGQFEQWRFRPGQRLHIRLPVEVWDSQLTLPADAVVVDGPNAFVFVEHHHEDEHEEESEHGIAAQSSFVVGEEGHEEEEPFLELEPVPVHLLHRDDKTVVIANDGQLKLGDEIALNNAYKLYLAMKMQSGEGGGHHHHHDH